MCPACFANAALLVAGIISTGGASALLGKALRKKYAPDNQAQPSMKKEKSS